jgi:hypothetical protein
VHILCTLILVLYWPEDGYEHVAVLTIDYYHFMINVVFKDGPIYRYKILWFRSLYAGLWVLFYLCFIKTEILKI